MTDEERDYQIRLALAHIKLRMRKKGFDPRAYNEKYLLEKATKLIDDWSSNNDGLAPYRKLEGAK